ncbi:MAG: hypothetical protein ACRDH9_08550 [Actinomycetota bacterium]
MRGPRQALMARGLGDYARDFWDNLFTDMPPGRWWRSVIRNRLKAKIALGCCGNRGEPGC